MGSKRREPGADCGARFTAAGVPHGHHLLFQISRVRVLQRVGTARRRVPDTYVPRHTHLIYPRGSLGRAGLVTRPVLCSPKLSATATSPARKTRCVSGRTNVAVAMDTSERAVTLVREFLYLFNQHYSITV